MSPDLIELRLGELSDRIKAVRELRGLTLAQLSAKSKVSPSTIQKVEARQMVPSVAVIMKIAAGLEMNTAELITPSKFEPLEVVEQRAGSHGRLQTSSDFYYEQLSSDRLNSNLHFWRVKIKAGGSVKFHRPVPFEEQIAVCESGKIEMNLDGQVYVLEEGDSLHVLKRSMVSLKNLRDAPSSYLAAGTLPQSQSFEMMARSHD